MLIFPYYCSLANYADLMSVRYTPQYIGSIIVSYHIIVLIVRVYVISSYGRYTIVTANIILQQCT